MIEEEYFFARLAVDKAKLSSSSDVTGNAQAKVAVVIENKGTLLGWAAKGTGGEVLRNGEMVAFDCNPKQHAEEALLQQLSGCDLTEANAYVTLEPCTERKKGVPCAQLLVNSGVRTVYVGNSDPHPKISNASWGIFFENKIEVKDFPTDLRNEARRDNIKFFDKFRYSPLPISSASFNYAREGAERILGTAPDIFRTRWTPRGAGSIYALDYDFNVCVAKHCKEFDQIDDPSRWFEDAHYTKPVRAGEIVIFRNKVGYALIKILEVTYPGNDGNGLLKFNYQIRLLNELNKEVSNT